jgi:tetratricopeptide (TPR) repeat protein
MLDWANGSLSREQTSSSSRFGSSSWRRVSISAFVGLIALASAGWRIRTCVLACLAIAWFVPAAGSAHGNFDERIEAIGRTILAEPTDPRPRLVRAELYRRHGDFATALRDLDVASQLSPTLARVDYFRGLVYFDSGRYAESEAILRRFLEHEPENPDAHVAQSRTLLKLERPLAAAREFDRAIQYQPVPIPDHYIDRAAALIAAGDAHLAEAIRGIDQGIAAIGPIVTLERVAVDLELRSGQPDAALARLEQIAERSPRREMWLVQLGEILARLGRTDEARERFSLALAELDRLTAPRRNTPAMARLTARIHSGMAALASTQQRRTP